MEIFPDYPQGNVDQVINRVSTLLSRTIPVIAIITKPFADKVRIKSLRLHKTSEDYITIVLATEMGMIKSQTILKNISEEAMKEIEKFLNTYIIDRSIDDIRNYMAGDQFFSERWKGTNVENIFDILKSLTEDSGEEKYTIRGFENLIDDETVDQKTLRKLIRTLETPDRFYEFLKGYGKVEDVSIFIGSEHFQEGMESFTSFIAPYKVMNEPIGYVLVIGTKVIDYQKAMTLTWYVGNRLTELLTFLSRVGENKR
uniref:Heat-inducible transcription repressor HrcA C-terminal domain-containing protein n=1 Tax=Mesoaciditoga lauensis TaxID=1495039 RepID=A0A7V3RFI5_9BACT